MRTEIRSTRPASWMPLRRIGVRRMTRAHLALAKRPQLGALSTAGLSRVAAALSSQLGCQVHLAATRVETASFPSRELGALAAFSLFELSSMGAKAVLELELSQVVALVERLCGARPSLGPVLELTRLEEGAFGFLNLVALAALRADPGFDALWAPRLLAVQGERSLASREIGSAAHVAFDLTLQVEDRALRARLYVPSDAILALVETTPEQVRGPIPEPIAKAELRLTCRTGDCELERETLQALRPGDVVLFGGARLEGGSLVGPARLVGAGFELAGHFDSHGFHPTRAQRRVHPQEPSMSPDSPSLLPVEIEVELTRVSVAVSELAALEPGSVLPLHMSASKPVLLRIGDRVVARAELVDIDGEVGARILSLNA